MLGVEADEDGHVRVTEKPKGPKAMLMPFFQMQPAGFTHQGISTASASNHLVLILITVQVQGCQGMLPAV